MAKNLIIVPREYPPPWLQDAADKNLLGDTDGTLVILSNPVLSRELERQNHLETLDFSEAFQERSEGRMGKLRYLLWALRKSFTCRKVTVLQYMDADLGFRSGLEALLSVVLFRGARIMFPVPDDNRWLSQEPLAIKWSIHDLGFLSVWRYLYRLGCRRLPDSWTVLYWFLFSGLIARSFLTRGTSIKRDRRKHNDDAGADVGK